MEKTIKVLGLYLDLASFEQHRCQHSQRGICQSTGTKHLCLRGTNEQGMFYTKIATAYPLKFARLLAKIHDNQQKSSMAKTVWKYMV